ncbi:SsrA-binding protein SmpB [Coxiella endosymbiont of Ornithodoros maritimus]|uniref:SsrA-binding protein SmpB n=1 Tax=Coxiella endosymbiont of Ornithodoros maritimus TaxID=1656172 RepID=UPI0022641F3F|nr:SsrA-binding protein SmpB [Coxiella endosymbiont of Ornithodoros maritimus]
MNKQISKKPAQRTIALNKRALHDYYVEQRFEAGLVLEGWEVKSIRAGRVQLRDSYVVFKGCEAWLIGAHLSPLPNVAEDMKADPQRSRKLLLNKREIGKLFGAVQKQSLTVVPLDLHWHKNHVKAEIALAKGKKTHDKRETIKRREWEHEKHRVLKSHG